MTIETVSRIVCDWCGCTSTDALASEDPIQLASNDGWLVYNSGDGDFCPQCVKNGYYCNVERGKT